MGEGRDAGNVEPYSISLLDVLDMNLRVCGRLNLARRDCFQGPPLRNSGSVLMLAALKLQETLTGYIYVL